MIDNPLFNKNKDKTTKYYFLHLTQCLFFYHETFICILHMYNMASRIGWPFKDLLQNGYRICVDILTGEIFSSIYWSVQQDILVSCKQHFIRVHKKVVQHSSYNISTVTAMCYNLWSPNPNKIWLSTNTFHYRNQKTKP